MPGKPFFRIAIACPAPVPPDDFDLWLRVRSTNVIQAFARQSPGLRARRAVESRVATRPTLRGDCFELQLSPAPGQRPFPRRQPRFER